MEIKNKTNILTLVARGKEGVFSQDLLDERNIKLNDTKLIGASLSEYSKDGKYLALVNPESVFIYSSESRKLVSTIAQPKILKISLSSTGKYLLTWERYIDDKNMRLYNMISGEILGSWFVKNSPDRIWPLIKFSSDDKVAAQLFKDEILFFSDGNFSNVASRVKLENISNFELSPNDSSVSSLRVAAFVPEKKGIPGSVKIYSYPQGDLVCAKSFFKAQEGDILWSPTGNAVIVISRTDLDKSGKSYYGETGIHLLHSDGKFDANIILKKEGPIHEVAWHPNGTSFVVVYGSIPPQTTLFDLKCQPLADFGEAKKNTVKFSPNGKLLAIGGFGNISGVLDIWDPKKLKKLAVIAPGHATYYSWSPDSRYILTATLAPRLNIDNGYKIWRYDGQLEYESTLDIVPTHLYEVVWRPVPNKEFPDRPISPRVYALLKPDAPPIAPPIAKYVPPHAKGQVAATSVQRKEEGPVKYKSPVVQQKEMPVGYELVKKEKKKKVKKPEEPVSTPIIEPVKEEKIEESDADPQKKARAVQKKLRQIEELKQQQSGGKQLDPAQLEKIGAEKQLRDELKKYESQQK